MDRTETTVRNMLRAIEAPLYDVGVLSDRGMLRGLDGISAEAVIEKLSLLKYRNARGSHIYIRPSGEHRYTALDDLSGVSLAKLTADRLHSLRRGRDQCRQLPGLAQTSRCLPQAARYLRSPRRLPPATTPIQVQPTGGGSAGSRLHQLQTQVQETRWPVPLRSPEELHRPAVPYGPELPGGDYEALRSTRTGTMSQTTRGVSFSPQGTEVGAFPRTLPHVEQISGPSRSSRHCLLCRRVRQWHGGGAD